MKSIAELVVDRKQRRNQRAIGLITWQSAKRRRVDKKPGNISQLSDRGIVFDCVRVIEMEAVLEMIRVSREKKCSE